MGIRKKLLDFMASSSYLPMTVGELYKHFNISRGQEKMMKEVLNDLVDEGFVYFNSNKCYGLPEKMNLVVGRIEGNKKGFAFLIPEDPVQEDIFISRENLNGAMHNDKVFLRPLSGSTGKRQEGEVVKIIERANEKVVGNFEKNKYFGFVVPDNKRIFYDLFIPKEEFNGARQGQKVVAEISEWPHKKRNPEGKIIEILGDKEDPGVDIEAIIRQLDLPRKFPEDVLKEVKGIPNSVSSENIEGRRDLRDLKMVTIDGADAKDLDDAVSIEEIDDNTYRLGVHIADVTHYVKENSILDKEAQERGTSIYLVDRVIPMLPPELSNGICSLNPAVERLTVSVFITYQLEPLEIVDHEITTSIIKTNYRLTYDEVTEMFVNNNHDVINKYKDIFSELEKMNELREKLREERFSTGAIDFNFPEVKVILNDDGAPISLEKRRHGIAEQVIEEFMIAANRVVAEAMYWREIPFIYRVHDQPDTDRLQEFNEFVHNFGYHLKGQNNEVHPRALQELLGNVKGEPEERVVNTMLLRSMKQAVYSPQNVGHFGLAIDHYCHFTSPIRRYPDLMIHRIIKEVFEKNHLSEKRREELQNKLYHIADHSSLQERRAMDAERDSVEMKKIEFMLGREGEVFEGVINGVTNFGFFVELENTVEGLVHVEDLKDDYYHYNEKQLCLVGEVSKKIYRFGDKVKVKLDKVNPDERQIDFVVAD